MATRPKTLFHVWDAWLYGFNGGKPEKYFTESERGANKDTYSDRRKFCILVEWLLDRGYDVKIAIDMIYDTYGALQFPRF